MKAASPNVQCPAPYSTDIQYHTNTNQTFSTQLWKMATVHDWLIKPPWPNIHPSSCYNCGCLILTTICCAELGWLGMAHLLDHFSWAPNLTFIVPSLSKSTDYTLDMKQIRFLIYVYYRPRSTIVGEPCWPWYVVLNWAGVPCCIELFWHTMLSTWYVVLNWAGVPCCIELFWHTMLC